MQDVHENLYAEIMSMASVFERMDCHNSANYMRKRLDNGFLSGALRSLYSDARTVRFAGDISGLDQRLINPNFPDDPGSKLNMCVSNILQIWRDGQTDKLT